MTFEGLHHNETVSLEIDLPLLVYPDLHSGQCPFKGLNKAPCETYSLLNLFKFLILIRSKSDRELYFAQIVESGILEITQMALNRFIFVYRSM